MIVYGTNYDFEFNFLWDAIENRNYRSFIHNGISYERPYDVVLVDEVDSLFIDSALNSARIALKSSNNKKWVYHPIFDFVKKNKPLVLTALNAHQKGQTAQWESFLETIKKTIENYNSTQKKSLKEGKLPAQKLKNWVDSAYHAIYTKNLNQDYVIKPKQFFTVKGMVQREKIVIVDQRNTGRLQDNSRWQHGMHEFLELKHNLFIEDESLMPASVCHPVFFQKYKRIVGVTGTMGLLTERHELNSIYNVQTFDIPPHKKSRRIVLEPKICSTKPAYFKALADEILLTRQQNRSILILCETIQEIENLSKYLEEEGIDHQSLTGKQKEDEDFIVAKAGQSGSATPATNTAGRGTDVILSLENLDEGGFYVVFSFVPDNQRVEDQGFGRAGRQGQPGSNRFILFIGDPWIQRTILKREANAFSQVSPALQMEWIKEVRETQIATLSLTRTLKAQIEQVNEEYLALFLKGLKQVYLQLDDLLLSSLAHKQEKIMASRDTFLLPETVSFTPFFGSTDDLILRSKLNDYLKSFQNKKEGVSLLKFIEEAKDLFLDEIKEAWSESFYTDLDDLN